MKLNNLLTLTIFIIILAVVFKIFIKLLPVILVFILISNFPYKKLLGFFSKIFIKSRNFESMPGQTYKQCSYCKKKADRTAVKCNFCGRSFE